MERSAYMERNSARTGEGTSAPIELPIMADVGVSVSAPNWQSNPQVTWSTNLLPFTVEGPDHVLGFLRMAAPGQGFGGYLSPPHQVTIQGRRARLSGIPTNAISYAFAYPLACLAGRYEELAPHAGAQPWLYFFLLGGYCYFDAQRRLLQTNAFVMTPQPHGLTMIGPFEPAAAAVAALRRQTRLLDTTLEPLRAQGFVRWAWINPGEKPGGAELLVDGGGIANNGAFIYELGGDQAGMAILCRHRPEALTRCTRPRPLFSLARLPCAQTRWRI